MKILNLLQKAFFLLSILVLTGSCFEVVENDTCYKTKWPMPKTFEIKLAVHISSSNPQLSGASPGSQKPEDFEKIQVSGTIQKFECNDDTEGPVSLGNTYLTKGVDYPAPINIPASYWFGHVVYVYEFDNDEDYVEIKLNVKISMPDGSSYVCSFADTFDSEDIKLVPTELYYYALLDVYADLWVKV